jgi:hypothetical protein
MLRKPLVVLASSLCCASAAFATAPPRAEAFNPLGTACELGGLVSGVVGKACSAGSKVLGIAKKVVSGGGAASTAAKAAGLLAITAWVLAGTQATLHEAVNAIGSASAPKLTSAWFSSTYLRVAAIGALLTMPFLFAAAIQALMRSDLALLLRAALGYLPLSLLAVAIAAPMTMLLLAATDEMCGAVSTTAGNSGEHFLVHAGLAVGALVAASRSPFLGVLVGLLTALAALALWVELVLREAAIYIVVLMLPIGFAAFVWPARRIWAVRGIELLVALVLSKFAIVAVLTLGGAALASSLGSGISALLAAGVLMGLAAFAPWALVRLLPLAELASGAVVSLRGGSGRLMQSFEHATAGGSEYHYAATARERDDEDDHPRVAANAEQERLRDAEQERLHDAPPAPVNGNSTHEAPERNRDPVPIGRNGAAATSDRDAPQAPRERLPGLPAQYQMPDFSWDLHVGADRWPPGPVAPALGTDQTAADPRSRQEPDRAGDPVSGADGDGVGDAEPPAEDHDPLPPAQEPEDGRL